jgi:hypothetical protein
MSAAPADRPVVDQLVAGDIITVSRGRRQGPAMVRCISRGPEAQVLYLEVPGHRGRTFPVPYDGSEVVERLRQAGWAA